MTELDGLSVEEIDRACRACLRTCKFFPTIAEILAIAQPAAKDAILLAAERAWDEYQKRIQTFCTLDGIEQPRFQGGQRIDPPELDAATEHAVRQCGGRWAIEYGDPRQEHFRRRDFLAAWVRYTDTDGLKQLPTRVADLAPELQGEVQKLLTEGGTQ